MSTLFADTFLFVAYLNPKDAQHTRAVECLTQSSDRIVTTAWVLAELGNFLAGYASRRLFVPLVKRLRAEPRIVILAASGNVFDRALDLYGRRPDKEWSVTDCTSFVVMRERRLRQALTNDHHFEQAGFTILMRESGV